MTIDKIIDYILQIQDEIHKDPSNINVVFWVGTGTIKSILEELKGAENEEK